MGGLRFGYLNKLHDKEHGNPCSLQSAPERDVEREGILPERLTELSYEERTSGRWLNRRQQLGVEDHQTYQSKDAYFKGHNVEEKLAMVCNCDAVKHPGAMVVMLCNAAIAAPTVLTS